MDLKKDYSFETIAIRCSKRWIWPEVKVAMLFYGHFYPFFYMSRIRLNCVVSSIVRQTDTLLLYNLVKPPRASCDVRRIRACLFRSQFSLCVLSEKSPTLFLAKAKPQHNYVFITFWKACFPSAHFCLFCLLYHCCTGPVAEIWKLNH